MSEENSSESLVVIGLGNMGSSWAEAFLSQGANLRAVIDPDPKSKTFLDKYEVPVYENLDSSPTDLSQSTWCITTPADNHVHYIKRAVERGVDDVLVEKPVSSSPEQIEELEVSGTNVSVDFIELEHPVVEAVLDCISSSGFKLGNAIHWRGKTSRKLRPYMKDDLVHDISEVFALYDVLDYDTSQIKVVNVEDVKSWAETERTDSNSAVEYGDACGTVFLRGYDEEPIYLTGGFNQDDERRYFLWIDESYSVAYFASTVTRDHLEPIACRISGSENIGIALQKCLNGCMRNNNELSSFVSLTQATEIKRGSTKDNGMSRMESIASKILEGNISPAGIQTGVEVDRLVHRIYRNQSSADPY